MPPSIFIHLRHVRSGPFQVVARNGEFLMSEVRFVAGTVNVGPGQRCDAVWTAKRPGRWLVHYHIPHHTANDYVEVHGGGGPTLILDVAP